MMISNIRSIYKDNLNVKKFTIKNSVEIIDTDNGVMVIKKEDDKIYNTYNYLISRGFDYFPKVIKRDGNYNIYEYIDSVNEPIEQKILDIVTLTTILHSKTNFYKEVDIDNYKYLYETISQNIDYLYSYYNNLIIDIEKDVYMSPSRYLIARNIDKIFVTLNYCKMELDSWYEIIKDKRKLRVVNIHNNLDLDHYLKGDKAYLISWNKNKIDMPIYDLIILYKKYYLDFDFYELFNYYESRFPLLEEERKMLFIMIALPYKLELNDSEYKNSIKCRNFFDYIYKTNELIKEYKSKYEEAIN